MLERDLGLHLTGYRHHQLETRLEAFLRGHRLDVGGLSQRLRQDTALARELRHALTVHVTAFFRDAECWRRLEQVVRASPCRHWRVWSCGTSVGAEAVSVAGLLVSLGREAAVWATDVDAVALEEARQGVYSPDLVRGLGAAARARLLEPTGDGRWQVRPEIARRISYDLHDLLGPSWPGGVFDLILCRNVLIYLGPSERERVLARLAGSLRPGGLLFLSATEVVLNAPAYGLAPLGHALYLRHTAAAGGKGGGGGG